MGQRKPGTIGMETPTLTKAPEIKQPLTRSGYVSRGPVGTSEGLPHSGSKSAAKAPRDAEQVAREALNGILATSIESRKEYGAMICGRSDGSCVAMPPRTQGDPTKIDVGQREPNGSCLPGTTPVAYYHTHPTYSVAGLKADYGEFSSDDIGVADDFSIDAYLGTLDGSFLKYDCRKRGKPALLRGKLKNTTK